MKIRMLLHKGFQSIVPPSALRPQSLLTSVSDTKTIIEGQEYITNNRGLGLS